VSSARRLWWSLGSVTYATLALELALIRWVSQQVRVFAYLNNTHTSPPWWLLAAALPLLWHSRKVVTALSLAGIVICSAASIGGASFSPTTASI